MPSGVAGDDGGAGGGDHGAGAGGEDEVGPGALVADGVVGAAKAEVLRRFLASCPQPDVQPRSLTASFWADAEGCRRSPSNPVEALVAGLLRRPDVEAALGDVAGAEWWWQDTDQDDPPKVYHVDQNVWMCDDGQSLRRCPDFGSVLYLRDEGGPTAAFGAREAVAVMPRAGRYFVFRGDRPHGVLWPPEGSSPERFERLTLLLNWWRERPPGLSEAPLAEAPVSGGGSPAEGFLGRADELGSPLGAQLAPPRVQELDEEWCAHAAEWHKQCLPAALRLTALSAAGCSAVKYCDAIALSF